MKTQKRRVRKMKKTATVERKFYAWPMNPWTPEQAAEAIRRHPDQTVFWRSAYERKEDTEMKMKYPDEDMTGARAGDWRAREGLVHVGQWDDFVAVPVRRMRRGNSRMVFLEAIRRGSAALPRSCRDMA